VGQSESQRNDVELAVERSAPASDIAAIDGPILAEGTQFGRYAILRRIGIGAMAEVYEAIHLGLKKPVALKILRPHMADNPDVRARFLREGEAASRIHHPNVVDITDVGVQDDLAYLVMALLEGETLEQRLLRDSSLSVHRAVDLILPVVAAVGAGHDKGVIHRDLKPENIFLARTRDGKVQPKLLDFGVSKLIVHGVPAVTVTTGVLGTPHYMSPEQAKGRRELDGRSDQYSVAVVLYECVTGQMPYDGDTLFELIQELASGHFKPPRAVRPDLPEEFEQIILRAAALEPADRYETMDAFGRALLPFASPKARDAWTQVFDAASSTRPAPIASTTAPRKAVLAAAQDRSIWERTPEQAWEQVRERARPALEWLAARWVRARRHPRALTALGAAFGGLLLLVSVIYALTTDVGPPAAQAADRAFRVSVRVDPPSARIDLDGTIVGNGSFSRSFPRNGVTHHMTITQPGYETRLVAFRNAPPPRALTLRLVSSRPP